MDASARRLVSFAIVAIFHVLMIWAFYVGLLHQMVTVMNGPIDAEIIKEKVEKKELPPPPPPKNFVPPPPTVVMPMVEMASDAPQVATITVTPPRPKPVVAAPAAPLVQLVARPDPRHKNARPDYPATSVRLKEEGTTILRIYIDETGSVAEAEVQNSSGSARLDEAAVRGVKSRGPARWKYLPAVKDGKPVGVWQLVSIKWELKTLGY